MGSWNRIFAGYYTRTGSDGKTVLARISRQDNGKWAYTVYPFGQTSLCWQVTGQSSLAEAKRMAEAGYRRYMQQHAELNKGA